MMASCPLVYFSPINKKPTSTLSIEARNAGQEFLALVLETYGG
jgi:hypothetical protein